MTILLARLAY